MLEPIQHFLPARDGSIKIGGIGSGHTGGWGFRHEMRATVSAKRRSGPVSRILFPACPNARRVSARCAFTRAKSGGDHSSGLAVADKLEHPTRGW